MTAKVTLKMFVGVTTMEGGSENDDHLVFPTDIPATPYVNYNMSTLNEAMGPPAMPRREIIESEIGMPITLDQNLTLFTNKCIIDDGYNLNGDLGPPRNAPSLEEGLNEDKEEVVPLLISKRK